MRGISRLIEKLGSLGVIVSAMGCASCFPALGALGASLGIGILSSYEGLLINMLLPLFALVALIVSAWSWYTHRAHYRGMLSVVGPIAVLAILYPLWSYSWSTYLFYAALMLMFVVAVFDVINPAKRRCATA